MPEDSIYRPFRSILREIYDRYRRPIFVAETGAEGDSRAAWLRYMGKEVRAAMRGGVPVEGMCLYPILDYPGWDNNRNCPSGLIGALQEDGRREVHQPLARELARQSEAFARLREAEAVQIDATLFSYDSVS